MLTTPRTSTLIYQQQCNNSNIENIAINTNVMKYMHQLVTAKMQQQQLTKTKTSTNRHDNISNNKRTSPSTPNVMKQAHQLTAVTYNNKGAFIFVYTK